MHGVLVIISRFVKKRNVQYTEDSTVFACRLSVHISVLGSNTAADVMILPMRLEDDDDDDYDGYEDDNDIATCVCVLK